MNFITIFGLLLLLYILIVILVNCVRLRKSKESPKINLIPEEPLYKQPKVYTNDCDRCVWKNPTTCANCPIQLMK